MHVDSFKIMKIYLESKKEMFYQIWEGLVHGIVNAMAPAFNIERSFCCVLCKTHET